MTPYSTSDDLQLIQNTLTHTKHNLITIALLPIILTRDPIPQTLAIMPFI
jgi:hypothetical protein